MSIYVASGPRGWRRFFFHLLAAAPAVDRRYYSHCHTSSRPSTLVWDGGLRYHQPGINSKALVDTGALSR